MAKKKKETIEEVVEKVEQPNIHDYKVKKGDLGSQLAEITE